MRFPRLSVGVICPENVETMADGLDFKREFEEITLPEILRAMRNWCISVGLWFGGTAIIAQIPILKEYLFYLTLLLLLPGLYWLNRLCKIECPKCGYHILKYGIFRPKYCWNCKAIFK